MLMRTVAIGLDGCSWNVLEPLLETGQLPHLAAIRKGGAHGILESVPTRQTGEDGKRAVELVQAAYQSNTTGRTIDLPITSD